MDLHPGDVLTVAPNNWVTDLQVGQPILVLAVLSLTNYSELLMPNGNVRRMHLVDGRAGERGGLPVIPRSS